MADETTYLSERSYDEIEAEIRRWITEADAVHRQYIEEWNRADDRLNSNYVPTGWTTKYSQALADANNPETEEAVHKSYVPVNRARPNHEAVLGDFIIQPKRLSISARNPSDRSIARVKKALIEYIEDSENIWEQVIFPAMDNAWSKGLHWIEVSYDAFAMKLVGRFIVEEVNARDVLVDPASSGQYFKTSRYRIRRIKMNRQDAIRKLRRFPNFDPDRLAPDTDYDRAYARTDWAVKRDDITLYRIHFRESHPTYYRMAANGRDVEEISEEHYEKLASNPITANFVFEGSEQDKFFIAYYTPSHGLIGLEENIFGMWTIFPLINIQTDSRLYPIGDVVIYESLLDLLDVLVTVLLENAKRSNIPIVDIDESTWMNYQEQIEEAIQHGGPIPGLRGIHYPQSINVALTQLIPWTIGWIQDAASKHTASMGELPAKQVAKETVQALIAKDRQSHGRKDVMLRLTMTTLAKVLVKMCSVAHTQADYIQVMDMRPGTPEYIPINQEWSEDEYLSHLAEIYDIELPDESLPRDQLAEANARFVQAIQLARKNFEKENDVKTVQVPGFRVADREFTDEELIDLVEKSRLTIDEFWEVYEPESIVLTRYRVNDISQDVDLNIRYGLETDFTTDKEFQANRALLLHSKGAMSRLDLLKALGVQNPEEILEAADNENQVIQIAKVLAANPEILEYVKQLLQSAGNGKSRQPQQVAE